MRGRGLAVAAVGVLVALTGLAACSGDEERPAAPIDASYARAFSALEPAPESPYECTFQGGPGFDLMLQLPDDRAVRVHGDTGGCGVVSTSGREWFGAQEVLDTVLAAVEDQRSRTTPPRRIAEVDLDCNAGRGSDFGRSTSLTGKVADLTQLDSCWHPSPRAQRILDSLRD